MGLGWYVGLAQVLGGFLPCHAGSISPQWSCITGKGLAQDTTQPIATTQREVRALYSVGWGTQKRVGLSTFHSFYLIYRGILHTLKSSGKNYERWIQILDTSLSNNI